MKGCELSKRTFTFFGSPHKGSSGNQWLQLCNADSNDLQASEPEFGKCLRSTIATLKQFNLAALRSVLPQFVNCVEHIVVQHCGQTPVNVLRAISTTETCPISMQSALPSSLIAPKLCTEEMHQKQSQCVGHFYQDYRMLPVALLSAPSDIDKVHLHCFCFILPPPSLSSKWTLAVLICTVYSKLLIKGLELKRCLSLEAFEWLTLVDIWQLVVWTVLGSIGFQILCFLHGKEACTPSWQVLFLN